MSARLESPPAEILITPLSPAGTVLWPSPLDPHATTVPSDFSARLAVELAAIWITPLRPAGTVLCLVP